MIPRVIDAKYIKDYTLYPNPDKPEMTNVECRMSNCGIASGFAFGYDPTGRSVYYITIDRLTFRAGFQDRPLLGFALRNRTDKM